MATSIARKERLKKSKPPVTALAKIRKAKLVAPRMHKKRERNLDPNKILIAERKFKVYSLRVSGLSVHEITKELEEQGLTVTPDIVSRDLREMYEETTNITQETKEQARLLQSARLDKIVSSHLNIATHEHNIEVKNDKGESVIITRPPNPAHAQIVLQAEQRRAKLLALDEPEEKGDEEQSAIRVYIGVNMEMV